MAHLAYWWRRWSHQLSWATSSLVNMRLVIFGSSTVLVFVQATHPLVGKCNEHRRWFWPPLGKKQWVLCSRWRCDQECWHTHDTGLKALAVNLSWPSSLRASLIGLNVYLGGEHLHSGLNCMRNLFLLQRGKQMHLSAIFRFVLKLWVNVFLFGSWRGEQMASELQVCCEKIALRLLVCL